MLSILDHRFCLTFAELLYLPTYCSLICLLVELVIIRLAYILQLSLFENTNLHKNQ
ncbi:hypothetical protein BCR42DRAFT_407228 [Absidia repens]|uniref:Uncharacterized protein n=1 Tax=Absidia repens TaxID=90262 RepID=A0A1X2IRX4_9FUNG|nr:hypothetical protein BCR42DRAFT_407228 [Absidia repens]